MTHRRLLALTLLAWLSSGVLSYGMRLAYWQRALPSAALGDCAADRWDAARDLLAGPQGLLWVLVLSAHGYQGMLWRCLPEEEARPRPSLRLEHTEAVWL